MSSSHLHSRIFIGLFTSSLPHMTHFPCHLVLVFLFIFSSYDSFSLSSCPGLLVYMFICFVYLSCLLVHSFVCFLVYSRAKCSVIHVHACLLVHWGFVLLLIYSHIHMHTGLWGSCQKAGNRVAAGKRSLVALDHCHVAWKFLLEVCGRVAIEKKSWSLKKPLTGQKMEWDWLYQGKSRPETSSLCLLLWEGGEDARVGEKGQKMVSRSQKVSVLFVCWVM